MAINLILAPGAANSTDALLQYIPAALDGKVEEDTDSPVFFDSYTSTPEDTPVHESAATKANLQKSAAVLNNMLRGYPVRGENYSIPETHIAGLFKVDENAKDGRTMRHQHQFTDFRLWNYDQTPSRNDGLRMALESFCLAEELHRPVDPIELELFLLSENDKNLSERSSSGVSSSTKTDQD